MSGLDTLQDTFVDDEQLYARRHPVRRFVFRLLMVLLLVAGASAIYAWRYQPLTNGSTYGVLGTNVRQTESAGGSNVVAYGAGQSFEMIFSVRNTSRVTTRIIGLPERELSAIMASYNVSMMPRHATAYDEKLAEPFSPFNLRPGEERLLILSYTFKNCDQVATAGSRAVRRQAVRYEFVQQWRRVAEVGLGQPLVITGMPYC